MKKIITNTQKETKKLGENIARMVVEKKAPRIIALEGDLGGGKTTFTRGFAKGLGIKEKILSPTFVLFRKFRIPNSEFIYFFHVDCYRVEHPKEIFKLGFNKILHDERHIIVIEWAEKIEKFLPKKFLKIKFKILGNTKREIVIK